MNFHIKSLQWAHGGPEIVLLIRRFCEKKRKKEKENKIFFFFFYFHLEFVLFLIDFSNIAFHERGCLRYIHTSLKLMNTQNYKLASSSSSSFFFMWFEDYNSCTMSCEQVYFCNQPELLLGMNWLFKFF